MPLILLEEKNLILWFIFYFPTMIATFPALILGGLFIGQLDLPSIIISPILIILSVILLLAIFSLIGLFIGWIIWKIKS